MKKNRTSREASSLRPAAFRVGPGDLGCDALLEKLLNQISGGVDPVMTTCTAFTCNLYAPPPPPG